MNGPSTHLSWREMACHDGTPYPKEWEQERASPLAHEFECIRAAIGKPLTILSAYRSPSYNARVPGAARNSQHVQGRALDLTPPKGMDVVDLHRVILARAREVGSRIRGIGVYAWGVHFDIRPSTRLAQWFGSKPIQVASSEE